MTPSTRRFESKTCLVVALGALLWLTPAPGSACINGVMDDLYSVTRDAREAEQLLARGRLRRAMRTAGEARVTAGSLHGETLDPWGDSEQATAEYIELIKRLDRILAITTIRLEGRVGAEHRRARRRVSEEARLSNLAWATSILETQLAASPNHPARIALAAEAWLLEPDKHEQAAQALQQLADGDFMPDVHGFAVLARLHEALENEEARDAAIAQCRARANRREQRLCQI